MRIVCRLALVLMSLTISRVGSAQSWWARRPLPRHGLTVSAGGAFGPANINCGICGTPRRSGGSGSFAIGYADSNYVLTAQARRWEERADDDLHRLDFMLFGLQYYPIRGFYIEQAIGYGGVTMHNTLTGDRIESKAVGYSMGMGYDFRVSHAFAITAFAHAMAVGRATPRYNGFVAREIPVNANAMQIGAVLTWQRGRHRRYIPSGER
jgi:hypothetical protein